MKPGPLLALLLAAGLVGGSCGTASTGSIVVSGSSTVEPISIAVAEKFNDRHSDIDLAVDGPGTGDGFELFCNAETDINDASSKIKDAQIEDCQENGVPFIELKIGNDGLSVMTNTANDAAGCLSFAELYALTGPESQGVNRWDHAEPLARELGATPDLPRKKLSVIGPGEESGTYASYVEIVIEDIAEERGAVAATRPDYVSSGNDNVILQGIQGAPFSLGWVGFAFARGATDVKILPISEEPGGECVEPNDATIADNSYPISRPLFIYVNAKKAEDNPALAAFVDFYLTEGVSSVSEVGYVELSPDDLAATRRIWEERRIGVN